MESYLEALWSLVTGFVVFGLEGFNLLLSQVMGFNSWNS